jgi:hypothetical protein
VKMTSNRIFLTGAALAGAILGLAWLAQAKAGDLGGSCCADLEERVAELEASTAKKGNRKVSLTVSGSVSRSMLWLKGDGGESEHIMLDNFNSPSRIRFAGDGKLGKDWSAGFLIELGISSFDDRFLNPNGSVLNALDEVGVRHQAVWLGTPVGKVWLGHTSTATDGIVEINLASGVNVGALPLASWLGADGGRQQVLKYESPLFAGVSMSASFTGENNSSLLGDTTFDAALRYAGEFSGIRLAAGIGYADLGSVGSMDISRLSGSASVMHVSSGVFLTVNAGRGQGITGLDPVVYGATAGIEKNFFGYGATTVFVEYSKAEDAFLVLFNPQVVVAGPVDKIDLVGLGINQAVDSLGVDIFLNYRRLTIKSSDIDVIMGGMRVAF